MKNERSGAWTHIAGALKSVGFMLLKFCAFIFWVVLSGISILLKHVVDALKQWLFPKEY